LESGCCAHNAILKVNNSPKAVYKGATIGEADGARILYVANFRRGRIDVFDAKFARVKLSEEAFEDDELPRGFAPFNVQNLGGNLMSLSTNRTRRSTTRWTEQVSALSTFSVRGRLLARLEHGSWFNAPWGVALAPGDFGEFSHHLVIAEVIALATYFSYVADLADHPLPDLTARNLATATGRRELVCFVLTER